MQVGGPGPWALTVDGKLYRECCRDELKTHVHFQMGEFCGRRSLGAGALGLPVRFGVLSSEAAGGTADHAYILSRQE